MELSPEHLIVIKAKPPSVVSAVKPGLPRDEIQQKSKMAQSFYTGHYHFSYSAGIDIFGSDMEVAAGVDTMNKRAKKNPPQNFWAFFPRGKKGMEMWQLVLIVLALLLLLAVLAWYGGLNQELGTLLDKFNSFT